ncbi:MAG: hypothetical protein ACSW75_01435 [Lachnospiraceae bacterium]
MKKISRIAVALLLSVVMLFAMTACGGSGGAQAEEVGKYTLYEMKSGDETITSSMLTTLGMTNAYLEMRADGTATMALFDDEKKEMKWADGKFTVDGDSASYTYKDGLLTITIEGEQMVFKKS